MMNLHTDCVCDRAGYISGAIYGKYKYSIPIIMIGSSVRITRAYDPVIVFCKPSRIIHNVDEYDVPEYLAWLKKSRAKIEQNYERYMSRVNHIVYDWTKDDDDVEFVNLLQKIKYQRESHGKLTKGDKCITGIGCCGAIELGDTSGYLAPDHGGA